MNEALASLIRRIDTATWLVLALLGLALGALAWGLSHIVRGLDFELLATLLLAGAAIGWVPARTRLAAWIAFPLAVVLAVVIVFVRVGQLGRQILDLLGAGTSALASYQNLPVRTQAVLDAFETLRAAMITLAAHLVTWLTAMASGQPTLDLVGLAMTWGLVLILIAAWAAWMLRRRRAAFYALAPLIFLFALVIAYTGSDAWQMLPLLGAQLALMVVLPHVERERGWNNTQMPSSPELAFDLTFVAVPVIAGIIAAAAIVPSFSPREIARLVEQWSRPTAVTNATNPFTNSLGLIPAPRPTTVFDGLRAPGLPRSHLLGAAPELLRQVAFTVQTDDTVREALPYYWQGSTYDLYTGQGWLTRNVETIEYRANDVVPYAAGGTYRTVRQTLRAERGDGLVYAAGTIVTIDHDFSRAVRPNNDLFAIQVRADEYRVESGLRLFAPNDLRAAGESYPQWVTDNYLSLPKELPPRVLALARDLTATAPTPYDRAIAIQDYLRTIPYTLDLSAPPASRDVVDYFLFDLRRGYCDYYATAMAVLSRAAGLPARVAVGYASGSYSAASGTYIVTEADAHSWTQIYFPDYGWVDFEPTSARSVIGYNLPEKQPPLHNEPASTPNAATERGTVVNGWLIGLGTLLILTVLPLSINVIDGMRLKRLTSNRALALLYQRIFRLARTLGLPVTPSDTPNQVALLLQDYFAKSVRSTWLFSGQQAASTTITQIVELYVETTYGAYALPFSASQQAIGKWQALRWRLALAVIIYWAHDRLHEFCKKRIRA